ncbi:MAG: chitosanase, partial [Gammaproteobacteria bacterium]
AQTTLASGNLFLLINSYVNAIGCEFGDELSAFLQRLDDRDNSMDHEVKFSRFLRMAGDDPVMIRVQYSFFDNVY